MKKLVGIMFFFAILLLSCNGKQDHRGKTPLVETNGQYLYLEDLLQVMPVNLTKDDSVLFAEHFIKDWVENVLLEKKAEKNIPDNEKVKLLVENYRKSLIVHTFQEELVRQELANDISDEEIAAYYEDNKNLFRLEQPLMKGLFIKVPLTASGLNNVRRWYRQSSRDAIENLEKYSIGNAVVYDYFYDEWKPVSEEAAKIPMKVQREDVGYLVNNRNIEVQDTAFCYFLHVEELLKADEIEPLDFAKDKIKEILINLKRVEFINRMKDELFDHALNRNEIKYYYLNTKE